MNCPDDYLSNMLHGCSSRWQTKKCCLNQSKSVRTPHATVGCPSRQHIIQTYGCASRSHTNAKSNRWNGLMDGWMDMPMDRWKWIGWIDRRMEGRHFLSFGHLLPPDGRLGTTQSMPRPCDEVAEAPNPNRLPWWASDPKNPSYERAEQQRLLQSCGLLNETAVTAV